MHHCDCSLNRKHKAVVLQYTMTLSKTCSHFRGTGSAYTHAAGFCHLNLQLIVYIKCASGHPPVLLFPRRKMTCSVAACSIFKSRCNLPTIPDGAECRGWVLDRHIYLTEGEGREASKSRMIEEEIQSACKGTKSEEEEDEAFMTLPSQIWSTSQQKLHYSCVYPRCCG